MEDKTFDKGISSEGLKAGCKKAINQNLDVGVEIFKMMYMGIKERKKDR